MKKLLYIPIALMLFGATACEDIIDLQPKDKYGIDEGFKNETDLQLFSNYFYPNVLTQNQSGDPCFDNQSDLMYARPMSDLLRGGTNRTVPDAGGGWSFNILRRINTLLEYAPKNCSDKNAVTKYTAVTRFFRAYFYYQKIKRFGDVPWVDRQLESDDDQLYAPRNSREFIMQRMLEDVNFAIENLPAKEKEAQAPYRVTSGAALALKSRMCLYEGTFRKYHGLTVSFNDADRAMAGKYSLEKENDASFYLSECVDASEKLMSGSYGKYKITNNGKPDEDYRNLFSNLGTNKDEYILAVMYDRALKIGHDANNFGTASTGGQPGYTRKFVATYLMKDGSRFTDKTGWQTMGFVEEMKDRDPRLAQSIRGLNYTRIGANVVLAPDLKITSTGYQPTKFMTQSTVDGINADMAQNCYTDLPEFRYAEVLLNLAEAKAELGTLTQADLTKTVGEIRKRVNMPCIDMAAANANKDPYLSSPETGYFNVNGTNDGVILEIRRERAIELMQEGGRWDDLMRWKCGKMVDQSFYGMYFPGPGSYDLTGDGKADVILYPADGVKPKNPSGEQLLQIGKDVNLSDETRGYVYSILINEREGFNEGRDYLYPIPKNEIKYNPNLTQNPGWK